VSKQRLTPQEAASAITGSVLRFSAQATKQIGDLLLPREPFLKRAFSSQNRNAERLKVLKLNCDIVIAHVSVAEYVVEDGEYWDSRASYIVELVRALSLQAISHAFEQAGCGVIDGDRFVREKAERFAIYCTTTLLENVGDEILKDHELPSRINAAAVIAFLSPSRISSYKELWAQDDKRMLQAGFVAEFPQRVYRHWHGDACS
jgi:hypothetical protein